MKKIQVSRVSTAVLSAIFALSAQAAESGISGGNHSFDADTTITTNAESGEQNRYSGIAATSGTTTVTIADGATLNIEGRLEDISGADRIYMISSQPGTTLTINGNLKGTILTSSRSSIRGIRAFGNTTTNGNLTAVISGGSGDTVGAEAWEGAHLVFNGDVTNITVNSTGGRVYGVQNHTSDGAVIDFLSGETKISVDNSSGKGTMSQGVLSYQSTTNFSGNTTIEVKGNTNETYGVNVECDPGDSYDTVVNFSGEETSITVTGKSPVFAVRPSGVPGQINFTGENVTISAESERSIAAGVWTQYGGHANFEANTKISAITHGSGEAYGVRVTNDMLPTSKHYAGNASFNKSLAITASADTYAAFGILNDSDSKISTSSVDDGVLTVAGTTEITVLSPSHEAYGISARGDLAKMNFGNVQVKANTETGSAYGLEADKKGIITLNGNDNSIISTGGKESIGVDVKNSGQVIMSGNTTAMGDTTGVAIDEYSSISVKENSALTTNSMLSLGTTNLSEASLLSITGGSDTESKLGTVNSTNAGINLGSGTYTTQALNSTGTTTVTLNDLTATTVNITNKSGAMTLAAPAQANDQFANAEQAADALIQAVRIETDQSTDKNNVVVAQGLVNDGLSATLSEDGQLTNVSLTKNSNVDGLGSINALGLMQWRHEMNDLTKRLGELRDSAQGVGAWARLYGSEQEYGAQSVTAKSTSIQVGADLDVGSGWKVGAAFVYTDGDAKYSAGDADYDSYGLALYSTWLSENGLFVDLIGKYSRLDSDFNAGALTGGYDNNAYSLSAEVGWHFKINDVFFVEPQAEFTWGHVTGDKFSAGSGVTVDQDDYDSLIGRIGLRTGFYFPNNKGTIYARVSGLYDFDGETNASVIRGNARNTIDDDLGGAWIEFGVGANFNWTENTYTYVDLEKNAGGEVKENWRFNVGVRHVF